MQFWQMVVLGTVSFALLFVFRRGLREQAKAREEETARREEAQRVLRERGELLENGRLACLVCLHVAATECWPRIVRSKLDRDLLGHRRLYNQTPMYALEDDVESGPALCGPHKRMVVRKLEQKLAEIRQRTANLNSVIEDELAAFETVELIAWARVECQRAVQSVEQALAKTDRLLPSPSQPPSTGVTVRLVPTDGEDSSGSGSG